MRIVISDGSRREEYAARVHNVSFGEFDLSLLDLDGDVIDESGVDGVF